MGSVGPSELNGDPGSTRPTPAWDDERLASPHTQADKAARVRQMFDGIAGRYSWINRVFSAGRDAAWRRAAVALTAPGPQDRVLDVASGTGDFLQAFAAIQTPPGLLVGTDFSHGMLLEAKRAPRGPSRPALRWCEADALRLPFPSRQFTIVSCAFGVRNFQDLDQGLWEMHRVTAPGGRLIILEFSRPRNRLFRRLYEAYAGGFMPWAAARLSGDVTGAYRYLPRSVVSFLSADEMRDRLNAAGFERVAAHAMTLGVVTLYRADRPWTDHG